ncbi:MAG: dethiobiotin synthetase [Gammaproteobacteria bacterium]|nr:MAG: dethiobiotin synthetase [Gammaproteobacteria bacterium]TND03000.1 MAG: dethiobiotin synthetase [Gammaproteobacteria bacterium]
MTKGYFITGTDTGVGKTTVSLGLLRWLRDRGYKTAAMKPVASGAQFIDGLWRNDDALQLQRAATVQLPYELVNPVALPEPVAPHIAAQAHGVTIDIDAIVETFHEIQTKADIVIVEGVGGWKVPLNDTDTTANLAKRIGLPVILVVGIRLGCLNHAMLTYDAIRAAGLPLAGWCANIIDPDCLRNAAVTQTLKARIDAPLIGMIPYRENATPDDIAAHIDLTGLL